MCPRALRNPSPVGRTSAPHLSYMKTDMHWLYADCFYWSDGYIFHQLLILNGHKQSKTVVSRGAVRSAASSYAAVRMVAGSRPVLVIA